MATISSFTHYLVLLKGSFSKNICKNGLKITDALDMIRCHDQMSRVTTKNKIKCSLELDNEQWLIQTMPQYSFKLRGQKGSYYEVLKSSGNRA
jgi:hypothetical protein